MNRILKSICLLALGLGACLLSSCATTPEDETSGNVTSSGERVNTLPWSRPERWEGQGPLGAAMQQRDPNMY